MEYNDTVIDNITTDTEDNSSEYRMLHPFPTSCFLEITLEYGLIQMPL